MKNETTPSRSYRLPSPAREKADDQRVRKTQERKVAATAAIVDSQTVKTADQAGARGSDAGKKLVCRKRHIAVDCMALLLAIMITPAAVQDRDAAKSVMQLLMTMYSRVQVICAPVGYLAALVQ